MTDRREWCGRFSIPFGMLVLRQTAEAIGLGAPANLDHFVGHPAAVWVAP